MEEKPITVYTGPERRTNWHTPENCSRIDEVCKSIDAVNVRLEDGDKRMERIEKNQEEAKTKREELAAKLDSNISNVDEVLDIIRAGKGFFKVIGALGNFIKWAAAVAAPVIALWFTLRGDK